MEKRLKMILALILNVNGMQVVLYQCIYFDKLSKMIGEFLQNYLGI